MITDLAAVSCVLAGAAVHHLARDLAADVADFPLQVAHAGFAGVVLDQAVDARIGEVDLFLGKPGGLHLLAYQEALGDLHLLQFGIAGEADHFHAVLQRRRNGVQHVGGGDEEYLAQVVLHVQVVIHEHEILLGIEHFEQRGRRIAAEIHGHLVHFVQHEDRIARAGLLHHLDDLAGQGADVGAAVAADFGFIAHAAERHAHKLAAGGLGDGHAQRSLAHARRPHEAQDGSLGILHQAAHRQEFQDALLDLFQAVMVRFEHLFGEVAGRGFPWCFFFHGTASSQSR